MRKIGDILLDRGLITKSQLDQALKLQEEQKKLIGEILLEKGFVTEETLTQVKASMLNLSIIQLKNLKIHPKIINFIPETFAKKYKMIPTYIQNINNEPTLFIAVCDEPSSDILKGMSDRLKLAIRIVLVTPSELDFALGLYYPKSKETPQKEEPIKTTVSTTYSNVKQDNKEEKKEPIVPQNNKNPFEKSSLESYVLEGDVLDSDVLEGDLLEDANPQQEDDDLLLDSNSLPPLELDFKEEKKEEPVIKEQPKQEPVKTNTKTEPKKIEINIDAFDFIEEQTPDPQLKNEVKQETKQEIKQDKKEEQPQKEQQDTQQKPKLNFLAAFGNIEEEEDIIEIEESKQEESLDIFEDTDVLIQEDDILFEEDNKNTKPLNDDFNLDEFSLTDPGSKAPKLEEVKDLPPPISEKDNKKNTNVKQKKEELPPIPITKQSLINEKPQDKPKPQHSFNQNIKKFADKTDPKISQVLSEDDAANNWVKEQKETPNTDMTKSVNILDVIDQLDNDEIDKIVFSKNLENFQKTFIEKLKQANVDNKTVDSFNKMFNNLKKEPINLLLMSTIEILIIENKVPITSLVEVIKHYIK